MIASSLKLNFIAGCAASMLFTAGCSTISDLNPFGADDIAETQGEVAGQSDRLTILSLADTLTIDTDAPLPPVIIPEAYVNENWLQPGGNQFHNMQHLAASGPLDTVWSRSIGAGSSAKGRVVASPVVVGPSVYAIDANNTVSATRTSDGGVIWKSRIRVASAGKTRTASTGFKDRLTRPFSLFGGDSGGRDDEAIGGGLTFSDGALYVSTGFGVMVKMNTEDGSEIWRSETRTPLHSAPTAADGRVYAISDDNEIFAFDANTGDVLWTYQGIIESARMLTSPSPAVIDDVVIAPFASGELVALRAQNGGVLWQDALSSTGKVTPLSSLNDIASGPVVADGYVFATAQSGVLSAFDLRTGQKIWSQPSGALGYPWVAGEFVYTVTTEGTVVCLSRNDGAVIWMTQLPAFENEKKQKGRIAWAGPIMAGGRLFVAGSHGEGAIVDPIEGRLLETKRIGGNVFVNPVLASETLYLLTDGAKLVALR